MQIKNWCLFFSSYLAFFLFVFFFVLLDGCLTNLPMWTYSELTFTIYRTFLTPSKRMTIHTAHRQTLLPISLSLSLSVLHPGQATTGCTNTRPVNSLPLEVPETWSGRLILHIRYNALVGRFKVHILSLRIRSKKNPYGEQYLSGTWLVFSSLLAPELSE